MLVISCSVCYHPRFIAEEFEEMYLLAQDDIICSNCNQWSKVPDDLKNEIRIARQIQDGR
jgi:hypothetical protein